MSATLLPASEELAQRLGGEPLVVMLAVDGTLAPIGPRPEEAVVPPETRRAVSALAARDGVTVALVSGRTASDARRMVSVTSAWVIGNHGYEIIGPDGEALVDPQVAAYRPVIAQAARRLASQAAAVPGVVVENKGWTLSIHHRLANPAVVPRLRSVIGEAVTALGLRLTEGPTAFEVRPPARIDRATAVLTLGRKLGGLAGAGSLAFLSDDRRDEDAFRALRLRDPEAVTVRVSSAAEIHTAAEFTVRDTADVRAFLEWLLAARP